MVERRLRDGVRIAQLLASEVTGHEGALAGLELARADPDVEATSEGALAYAVTRDGAPFAEVYVHPDRARVEVRDDRATGAAAEFDLPVTGDGAERVVFEVESGAAVKRALRVFETLA
jgi:hypothetical protein